MWREDKDKAENRKTNRVVGKQNSEDSGKRRKNWSRQKYWHELRSSSINLCLIDKCLCFNSKLITIN